MRLVVVDTPVGRIGLTVCYDLRFPELYQQLIRRGAELLQCSLCFYRSNWASALGSTIKGTGD